MKTAVLHDVIKKKPELYPIFEIMGTVDCGKKLVAELVAARLTGSCIQLPVFDLTSYTGRALLQTLTSNPENLELNPYWWAHIYAANIHEQYLKIQKLREQGPVIITNYTSSFKVWMGIAGVYDLSSYFGPLPEPLHTYSLLGSEIETSTNLSVNFSKRFKERINKGVKRPPGKKFSLINIQKNTNGKYWDSLNESTKLITKDIKERYNLIVQEGFLYNSTLTITRK
jgi:hypothetical protein